MTGDMPAAVAQGGKVIRVAHGLAITEKTQKFAGIGQTRGAQQQPFGFFR